MPRSVPTILLALASLAGCPLAADAQTVLRVDDSAAPGGNGLSWLTSFRHLTDAIAAAAGGGVDEIRIAGGTYFPDRSAASPAGTGSRFATFALPLGVALRGGYAGITAPDPDLRDPGLYLSILSGAIGTPDPSDNSFHVVTAAGPNSANELDGLRVVDGRAIDGQLVGGGLHLSAGTLAVTDCWFEGNHAQTRGGAVAVIGGTLVASGTRFEGSTANSGGAVFIDDGAGSFLNCDVMGNSAAFSGGAIRVEGNSTLEVIGGTFEANVANGNSGAGAISTVSPGLTLLQGVSFVGNSSAGTSGAIAIGSLDWTVTDCAFIGNSSLDGAGALTINGYGDLLDTVFEGNTSAGGGGAVEVISPSSSHPIVDCHFEGNSVTSFHGGAIYCYGNGLSGELVLRSCTFDSNVSSAEGGAVYLVGYSALLEDCTFTNNSSLNTGSGAVRFSLATTGSTYRIERCDFIENSAPVGGPGAAALSVPVEIVDCWFEANTAGQGGGAVMCDDVATVRGTTFLANQSDEIGGGLVLFGTDDHLIVDCDFIGNTAGLGGGLSYRSFNPDGVRRVIRCRFLGNSVVEIPGYPGCGGGGAYVEGGHDFLFAHCIFSGNVSDCPGGAIRGHGIFSLNHIEVAHCTISENVSTGGCGGIHSEVLTTVANTIVWGNDGAHPSIRANQLTATEYFGNTSITVDHACVEGWDGGLPGIGSIGLDPLFLDPLGVDGLAGTLDDDLRIPPGSPCSDSGSNSAIVADFTDLDSDGDLGEPAPFDLAGFDRRLDDPGAPDTGEGSAPIVDIGAYEAIVGSGEFTRGDANDDGVVDIADAISELAFLFQSGEAPHCADGADANDDGAIDVADPIRLLAYLFSSGPAPGPPGDVCGADPTPDLLGCGSLLSCP